MPDASLFPMRVYSSLLGVYYSIQIENVEAMGAIGQWPSTKRRPIQNNRLDTTTNKRQDEAEKIFKQRRKREREEDQLDKRSKDSKDTVQ